MVGNYWSGRNVALLGGANLIGTHLALNLQSKVRNLIILDNLSSGKMENIPSSVRFEHTDLREHYWTFLYLKRYRIDTVFHLAAQHGGRGYVATHDVELYNNLELDTTIFRACADAGVEKVIFSSSACAYPVDLQTNSDDYVYLSEDKIDYKNMRQADGAYGTEKLVGEQMLDAYIEKGYFKGCSTRSFTVYGPLMNESHAIAALIAKVMIRQNPLEVWGNGEQIRNWTYVEDNVQGAILAAEHLDRGAINIGIEERLTPLMALEIIYDYMGWKPDGYHLQLDKPTGPRNRVADAYKLKSLGWKPSVTFEEGLRKTVDWYVRTHNAEDLKIDLERKLTER
jgi:nucleoside-diphosphate-sugar epimerase